MGGSACERGFGFPQESASERGFSLRRWQTGSHR